jgi:hypothetical protein
METMEARLYNAEDMQHEFGFGLPDDCDAVIELVSAGKTQYFALSNREDAQTWVNTLKQMRQDSITRKMGHSNVPYPKEWVALDSASKRLRDRKSRIQAKLENMEKREMEMQSLGGGSLGYYS